MDAAKHLRLVLQGFMSYDYKGEQRLHADDFPKALQSLGLKFGDPVVDSVMPLCQIDADTGFVRARCPPPRPRTRRCPAPHPRATPRHVLVGASGTAWRWSAEVARAGRAWAAPLLPGGRR